VELERAAESPAGRRARPVPAERDRCAGGGRRRVRRPDLERARGLPAGKLGFADGFADPCDITFKLLRGDINDSDSALVRASVLSSLGEAALGPSATEEFPSSDGQGLVMTWPHGEGGGIARIGWDPHAVRADAVCVPLFSSSDGATRFELDRTRTSDYPP